METKFVKEETDQIIDKPHTTNINEMWRSPWLDFDPYLISAATEIARVDEHTSSVGGNSWTGEGKEDLP